MSISTSGEKIKEDFMEELFNELYNAAPVHVQRCVICLICYDNPEALASIGEQVEGLSREEYEQMIQYFQEMMDKAGADKEMLTDCISFIREEVEKSAGV